MTSRRSFLRAAALAGGWFAFRGLVPSRAMAAGKTFPPGKYGGNVPTFCHDVRDGKAMPSVAASRKVDVVVVGAGPNGLAAALTCAEAGRSSRRNEKGTKGEMLPDVLFADIVPA